MWPKVVEGSWMVVDGSERSKVGPEVSTLKQRSATTNAVDLTIGTAPGRGQSKLARLGKVGLGTRASEQPAPSNG